MAAGLAPRLAAIVLAVLAGAQAAEASIMVPPMDEAASLAVLEAIEAPETSASGGAAATASHPRPVDPVDEDRQFFAAGWGLLPASDGASTSSPPSGGGGGNGPAALRASGTTLPSDPLVAWLRGEGRAVCPEPPSDGLFHPPRG
ncbi:MAG: hypothetical protein DCC67_18645 [Planctomycetota bacterium]|nr:MAG: hypothetical protein DCC67_18645 [Planctomycetota bacterium]